MSSFLLTRVARGVLPVTLLFAVYLLLRGHDAPGGGFVAGLVTSAAMILHSLAWRPRRERSRRPRVWAFVWIGLLLATGTGFVAIFTGADFFTHLHVDVVVLDAPALHLSTTLLFDVGVSLLVIGSTMTALTAFAEGVER